MQRLACSKILCSNYKTQQIVRNAFQSVILPGTKNNVQRKPDLFKKLSIGPVRCTRGIGKARDVGLGSMRAKKRTSVDTKSTLYAWSRRTLITAASVPLASRGSEHKISMHAGTASLPTRKLLQTAFLTRGASEHKVSETWHVHSFCQRYS